jgi:hypothetical protein
MAADSSVRAHAQLFGQGQSLTIVAGGGLDRLRGAVARLLQATS